MGLLCAGCPLNLHKLKGWVVMSSFYKTGQKFKEVKCLPKATQQGLCLELEPGLRSECMLFLSCQQILTSPAVARESHGLALLQAACSAACLQGGQAQLCSLDSATAPCPFPVVSLHGPLLRL